MGMANIETATIVQIACPNWAKYGYDRKACQADSLQYVDWVYKKIGGLGL